MSEAKRWRLMLVDNHRILLDGIKTLLALEPDLK